MGEPTFDTSHEYCLVELAPYITTLPTYDHITTPTINQPSLE